MDPSSPPISPLVDEFAELDDHDLFQGGFEDDLESDQADIGSEQQGDEDLMPGVTVLDGRSTRTEFNSEREELQYVFAAMATGNDSYQLLHNYRQRYGTDSSGGPQTRWEVLQRLAQITPGQLNIEIANVADDEEDDVEMPTDADFEIDDDDVDYEDEEEEDEDEYEEEDDDFQGGWRIRRRRCTCKSEDGKPQFPPVPSPEGIELMASGEFGDNEPHEDVSIPARSSVPRRIMARELLSDQVQTSKQNRLIAQRMIPASKAETIINYDQRCYSGQFSTDGNFYFSCSQDYKVRMYDTSNPYNWQYYKTVRYPFAQWTITDATLSPNNKLLAYSSIRSHICLASTDPGNDDEPQSLDFAHVDGTNRRAWREGHFGIWSVRFSGDGRELVAGTSDHSVYVYDLESNKTILKIPGHHEDVNAVCYGDAMSPHILFSGSDDTLIKVWDRRSLRGKREAGVFVGHTEGVTYVDSKGDGRYVLSNGKDQSMKLWDIRKMMSTEESAQLDPQSYKTGFDYRFMTFRERDYMRHPKDCSVVTFRGHSVLKTLIRCHFSPPGSSNSRYVYSGSENGKVYIYNMDATTASVIDVGEATYNTRPQDSYVQMPSYIANENGDNNWSACVRDASWHPHVPMIAATSWNGWGMKNGTCTVHVWKDCEDDELDPELDLDTTKARRVNERLEHDPSLYEAAPAPAPTSAAAPPPDTHQGQEEEDHNDDDGDEDGDEDREAAELFAEMDRLARGEGL